MEATRLAIAAGARSRRAASRPKRSHISPRTRSAQNLRQPDGAPLTPGRIQLQSEGAEVFYRNLEIQPLE